MSRIQYQPDYTGLRDFLVSGELRDICTAQAGLGVEFAKSIAPVGNPEHDRHAGTYRDSIHLEQAGVGGLKRDRVQVDVVADAKANPDDHASYAATLEVQKGHHTLGKAIPIIEGH